MRTYALVSDLAADEAIEIYLRQDDAIAAMKAAIADVPGWKDVLRVEAVELDDAAPSRN